MSPPMKSYSDMVSSLNSYSSAYSFFYILSQINKSNPASAYRLSSLDSVFRRLYIIYSKLSPQIIDFSTFLGDEILTIFYNS